ncbi:ATP-dependent DNA helicase [Schizosaccharomyces japonicus yFS275]|uniref:DNA helicase n=1 Tax=Schizosaccharomyces japonicus (strain yFS275 / FY16936) TaxID=402676 RepID=B6K230_SCHJY|nr:ATP-dependent DNA helicase [Schizosaccharomyces japonicus yFS275]EEB07211.1 ATP-dependent DNA helicase [Schizosaccharomyces japonicus yFS275]
MAIDPYLSDDDWDDIDEEAVQQIEDTYQNTQNILKNGESIDEFMNRNVTEDNITLQHQLDTEAAKTWIYPINIELRDYQFNIVKKALTQNVLVALPTGLGKTFIAAVLMMNYLRWFPQSYVVFLAPTKPLVTQQMEACYKIAGIPKSCTAELSGQVPVATRAELYKEKKVFFLTPQTLQNDLKRGICDRMKISCLVVDEAHRSLGNYSYVEVVRLIYMGNRNFRVLALTATPGSKIDTVQSIVDSLHISCIEIRNENSIDIAQYVYKKNVDCYPVDLNPLLCDIRDRYCELLEPFFTKLTKGNLYWVRDIKDITAFTLLQAKQKFLATAGQSYTNNQRWDVLNTFDALVTFAYPLGLLLYHGITPFYSKLKEIQEECSKGRAGYKKRVLHDQKFIDLMSEMSCYISQPDFLGHPKLEHLQEIVLNHFGENKDTRIMVFAEIRSSAEEIHRLLSRNSPTVRSAIFVGQSAKKAGGMSQKLQNETVQKFHEGEINTLIATSIGEEGLDIGEVDLIICYDASSSPIRMLQRMGRTGRKREGNVSMLLTRGKEENKWARAKDAYRVIQENVSSGNGIVLSDKSYRILPKQYNPECVKKVIEIPKENIESKSVENKVATRRNGKKTKKKFFMPENALLGFIKVSSLGKRSQPVEEEEFLLDEKDDWTERHPDLFKKYQQTRKDRQMYLETGPDVWLIGGRTGRISHSSSYKGLKQTIRSIRGIRPNIICSWNRLLDDIKREERERKHGKLPEINRGTVKELLGNGASTIGHRSIQKPQLLQKAAWDSDEEQNDLPDIKF